MCMFSIFKDRRLENTMFWRSMKMFMEYAIVCSLKTMIFGDSRWCHSGRGGWE